MIVELKLNQEKFIKKQIKSGRFENEEQVIEMAFNLLEMMGEDYLQWVEETRNKIDIAISEIEEGQGLDGETVVTNILERFSKS
jgi:antitoxin ParD1/3/4